MSLSSSMHTPQRGGSNNNNSIVVGTPSYYHSLEEDDSFDSPPVRATPIKATATTPNNNNRQPHRESDGLLNHSYHNAAVNSSFSSAEDDELNEFYNNENNENNHNDSGLLKFLRLHMVVIGVLSALIIISVLTSSLVLSNKRLTHVATEQHCSSHCKYQLVESIPDQVDLELLPGTNYTVNAWLDIINNAQKTLKIAAFYSNLRNDYKEPHNIGGWMGNQIMEAIVKAHERGVAVTLVQNSPVPGLTHSDTDWLRDNKIATVVYVDWGAAFGGVLHTKMLISDDVRFYVGSANLDWTSLAQVKELGIYVSDCSCLAGDIEKIWGAYKYVGSNLKSNLKNMAHGFPSALETKINIHHPLSISFANDPSQSGKMFFSSGPQAVNPLERTNDIAALLSVINGATRTLSISVMDYLPLDTYGSPRSFWGEIEDALKNAITRNVTVQMLISKWSHSSDLQVPVISSLNKFGSFCKFSNTKNHTSNPWCTGSITVKLFEIPDAKGYEPIPFTRVNHAKFMVSDNTLYLSTSNWSYDYFYRTAGVSLVTTHPNIRQTVQDIFTRDWNSAYVAQPDNDEMEILSY